MSHPIPGFHAIVPAGGAGTRLWPLSRAGNPKFLLDLTGAGRSLLQGTVARLLPLTGAGGVVVVTGARHADAVGAQLAGLDAGEVIAEPSARDSMAAIGLAAAVLAKRHGDDTIVGSFAADHVIADGPEFAETITQAVAAAREGYVVTIGIAASWPSTAFGYVRSGASLGIADAPSAALVSGFTEKPDAETAEQYLSTGEYRWNAGMFVASAGTLLGHLRTTLPTLHDGLRAIAEVWDTPERAAVLEEIWPTLTKIAIDHAIAEPVAAAGGVAVVPGNFSWDDVGDFASLAPLLPSVDGAGSRTLGDETSVLRIDAPGAVVATTGVRTVTVIGIPDAVVVDTADALLVTTKAMAQQVKLGVDGWRERGRTDLV